MTVRVSLSIACAVTAAISVPMILRKIPPNPVYGFRTRLTLSKPEVWYPANAFSGWALLFAAALTLAALWVLPEATFGRPWTPLAVFLGPLIASVVASFVYLRRFSSR
jgi:hypothetical protein